MTEIKTQTDQPGQVQIADEVIAIIIGTAAMEIDGVAGMSGNLTGGLAEIMGRKNAAKGVKIEVTEDNVAAEINLLVKFGYNIQKVCQEVQKRVKTAIETMTGLTAGEININVVGVHLEKEKAKDSEN